MEFKRESPQGVPQPTSASHKPNKRRVEDPSSLLRAKLFGRMIRMTMRPTKGRLALALVASFAGGASANYDKRFAAKNKQMAQLQELIALSPVQVLESLDEYEQFWVEAFGGRWVLQGES